MKNKIIEVWNTLIYGKKWWELKVEFFSGNHYACYYKTRTRGYWKKMIRPLFSSLFPICRTMPFLGSFEECVKFARQFKSYEEYKNYEDATLKEFDKIYSTLKREKELEKQKVWRMINNVAEFF